MYLEYNMLPVDSGHKTIPVGWLAPLPEGLHLNKTWLQTPQVQTPAPSPCNYLVQGESTAFSNEVLSAEVPNKCETLQRSDELD